MGGYRAGGAAADGELANYGHLPGFQGVDQVIQDRVDNGFVEDALITEGEEVEFQALHLHAPAVGHVRDRDGSKIRLPGHGADAGELGEDELDLVVALGARVGERVEDGARLGGLTVGRGAVTFPQEV